MVSEALDVVFFAFEQVTALFLKLSGFFDVLSIAVGFFAAFCVYRFIVRPIVGSSAVDPSSVLRAFKGADSDEARKPEKK